MYSLYSTYPTRVHTLGWGVRLPWLRDALGRICDCVRSHFSEPDSLRATAAPFNRGRVPPFCSGVWLVALLAVILGMLLKALQPAVRCPLRYKVAPRIMLPITSTYSQQHRGSLR